MKNYIHHLYLSTILMGLLLAFPVLSQAEPLDNKPDDTNLSKSDYSSTYKQFLQFDGDSIFTPSTSRLQDVLGAFSNEDRLHLNVLARFQYNVSTEELPRGFLNRSLSLYTTGELFFVDAEYSLLKGRDYDVRAAYTFLQNLDNNEPVLNQQSHVGSLMAMHKTDFLKLPVYLSATYSYGYSFFNDREGPFQPTRFKDHVVRPSVTVIENKNNMTILQYRFVQEEENNAAIAVTGRSVRTFGATFNVHEGGFVHYLGSSDGKYYLYGGFSYDWLSTADAIFTQSINSRKYSAGLKATLPYKILTTADYSFQNRWNAAPHRLSSAHEDIHVVSARVSKEILKNLIVLFEYDYNNDRFSGNGDLVITKSIYSGGLNWRF